MKADPADIADINSRDCTIALKCYLLQQARSKNNGSVANHIRVSTSQLFD